MELFYFNQDNTQNIIECGIDEAGRGPLIGNVYAAAVIWPINLKPCENLIKDSKKLSSKKRQKALEWINKNIPYYGIGYATNQEIDSFNILEATKLAMERAINNLQLKPTHYIIDGIGWEKKFNNLNNVKSIIKGDSHYYSIAAASILAKEYHDQYIMDLCELCPELNDKYQLKSNMGYASKKHIEGVIKHGYCEYHRKSFKLKCT
jgi:ribonuclease HII